VTSFNRWLGAGKIPQPRKIGHLNRWLETEMVAVRDAGIAR
jgi:predicted DNA-binding transcriptional regulator AlpA